MTYGEQARVFRTIPGPRGVRDPALRQRPPEHVRRRAGAARRADAAPRAARACFSRGRSRASRGTSRAARAGFVCARDARAVAARACDRRPPPETTALGGIRTHLIATAAEIPAVEHHLGVPAAAREPQAEEAGALRGARRAGARGARGVAGGGRGSSDERPVASRSRLFMTKRGSLSRREVSSSRGRVSSSRGTGSS